MTQSQTKISMKVITNKCGPQSSPSNNDHVQRTLVEWHVEETKEPMHFPSCNSKQEELSYDTKIAENRNPKSRMKEHAETFEMLLRNYGSSHISKYSRFMIIKHDPNA